MGSDLSLLVFWHYLFIIWIKSYVKKSLLTMPDIGGNLAVVSLLLVYAYCSLDAEAKSAKG
ncbi:MAG: hypothetical protein ACJAZM_001579 [Cyclobacteriaceae bacterium]|jgi:hypothetical protein